MRKLTHEEVEAKYRAAGYTLLSQYENATAKLRVLCAAGHQYQGTWTAFSQGKRCPECAKRTRANKRRTPQEVVFKAFADEGYQLLVKQYQTNITRMDCLCPKNHRIKMDWASFREGTRCYECAKATWGQTKKRNTALKAKAAFQAAGYTLLDDYIDSHTPMRFRCPDGHEHQLSWTNFDAGYRCAFCSGHGPIDPQQVRQAFEAEGYRLLDSYTSSKKRMRFICPAGHKWSISLSNWNAGHRCGPCAVKIVTHKQVKEAFRAVGYKLLSQYRGNAQKLKFECDHGHHYQISWRDFNNGVRCALCTRPPVDPAFVEEFFLAAGYTPLAQYGGSNVKIPYRCPQNHEHAITWHSFKSGCRCPQCQGKLVRHEEVEMAFAAEGYQLLDRYQNSSSYLRYICPEEHQHQVIWDAFKQGVRCPYCAGMHPSPEQLEINKIKRNIATLIHFYLRRQDAKKPFSISTFAAQVATEVTARLGERPQGHHLDHVIPQSYFDFRNQNEIEACWHVDNLRWLPALANISRGHRLTIQEVESFTPAQLELLAAASLRPKKFNAFVQGQLG
ncbi:MAG TPA: hypothetical protein V6D29_05090 [Leptolyngbyaceae cyanobacterium]